MFGALGVVLAAAAGAHGPALALPPLRSTGLEPSLVEFATNHLAQQLSEQGFDVLSSQRIASVLGLERQKALLGCEGDGTSCAVEFSNALGATAIVTGSIGRIGTALQVNLVVVRTRDARQLGLFSKRVQRDEELLDALTEASRALREQVGPSLGLDVSAQTSRARPGIALSVAAGGLIAGGLGLGLNLASLSKRDALLKDDLSYPQAVRARSDGQALQLWGTVALGVGGGALIGAVVLWLWPTGDPPPSLALLLSRDAVGLALTWRCP